MAIVKLNLSGHDNAELTALGYKTYKMHVDLADPELPGKVAKFLQEQCGVGSSDSVYVALPGLGALAVITMVALHGITGQFASLVAMSRNPDGTFSPVEPIDLQSFRNDLARAKHREGVVVL